VPHKRFAFAVDLLDGVCSLRLRVSSREVRGPQLKRGGLPPPLSDNPCDCAQPFSPDKPVVRFIHLDNPKAGGVSAKTVIPFPVGNILKPPEYFRRFRRSGIFLSRQIYQIRLRRLDRGCLPLD
jgi:hypothetical protein